MTTITVDKEKCKGCLYCAQFCAKKVFAVSDKVNEKGVRFVVADSLKCSGCGLCFIMCPDCAIEIK